MYSQAPPLNQDDILLILEDEVEHIMLMEYSLREVLPHLQTAFYRNGYDFYDAVVAMPVKPKLVILDVRTPPLNGVETLQRLKRDFPKIVVAMFSFADTERAECEALNCDGFYVKPENPAEYSSSLLQIVRELYPIDPLSTAPFPL